MARPGPAPLVDERRWVPPTIEDARWLYERLVDEGTPVSQARGIVTWLIVLPEHRSQDPSTDSLRRDYRRQLQRLGLPPWELEEAKTRAHSSVRHLRDARTGRQDRRIRRLGRPMAKVA